jgi:hypothetical protein
VNSWTRRSGALLHVPRRVPSRAPLQTGRRPALVAILATLGFLIIASSAGATPLAQFHRMSYSNQSSPSDAHLQIAVVSDLYATPAYVASLRAASPGVKVLAYQTLWWMRPSDTSGSSDCLPGKGSYPEAWYMHNGAGAREIWSPGTTNAKYAMDFANSAYLAACEAHVLSVVKATGADGVFFDGSPTSLHWAQLPTSCTLSPPASPTCASDTSFQNAMASALTYMSSSLHANGKLVVSNISGGNVAFCCHGGPAVWQKYVSQIDGAMQESWTYGTNHLPLPATEVQAGLLNTAWSEARGKYTMLNDDITNCESCDDYGLASMLLVATGRSSYDTANGSYAGNYGAWWPSFNTAQNLGSPLGGYTPLADGLMVRKFANGWVAVNDTTAAIADPTYGAVPATSAIIN